MPEFLRRKGYSFVVTFFDDGYLAEALCAEFERVFRAYLGVPDIAPTVELILVNDGSRDATLADLRRMASIHPFVRVVDLSRNFGQHVAILCGYAHATGEVVGRLNADMQDPPKEIPRVLEALQAGKADMVVGLQRRRESSWLDRCTSRAFFSVFNFLVGASIPPNTATLRAMRRRYVDALLSMGDREPFLQGLETWVGFDVAYLPTEHQRRRDHRSAYTFAMRLRMAIDAAVSFSSRPLRGTVYLGVLIAVAGFLMIGRLIVHRLVFPDVPAGYTSTLAVILFAAGVQILVTGLSGLYIGKIMLHVQGRPLYVVRERINFEK